MRPRLGFALSLVTATLWGSLPVALKSLLGPMSTLTVSWYRYLISALLLTAFLHWRGKLPALPTLRPVALTLAGVVLGFTGNNILFLAGLNYVGPSAAEIVIQLAPVLLIVAGLVIFGEQYSQRQAVGMAILIVGMGLFFHRDLASIGSPGVLLIVASSVLWAAYAVLQKHLQGTLPSQAILWVVYGAGAVLLLPAVTPSQVRGLDTLGWVSLLYCCLNSLIAYGSFAEAMSHWEVSRVSAVLATTPLFTPVFAELAARLWPHRFAHEGLDWLQLAGGVLVAGGSILAALARKRR